MQRLVRAPALLVVGILLLQAAWILTVPPFRGSDEFDHSYRAAAVADGEVIADDWASDGRGLYVTVPRDIVAAARFQCEGLDYTGPENCAPPAGTSEHVRVASGAGLYHPAFYWLVGTAAQPFEGAAALYAMRIATALLCLLFIGVAVWATTRTRSRWPTAGLVVALSPVLIYSTTIVAPNGVEMAAGLALWASLLAVVRDPGAELVPRLLLFATVAAVSVCTLRMLGPLFVALIVGCVVVSNSAGARRVLRERRRALLAATSAVVVAGAGAAGWVLANGQTGAPPGPRGGGAVNAAQVLVWNLQTIAAFPIRNQPGALIIYPIVLVLVAGIVLTALRYAGRGERSAIVGGTVVVLALPLALTLATEGDRGVIWQGRYVLPFGVGLLLMAGYALARVNAVGLGLRFIAPAALGLTVGISACLIKVRNDEIARGSEAAWHAPPAALLVALTAIAVGMVAAAVLKLGSPVDSTNPVRSKVNV